MVSRRGSATGPASMEKPDARHPASELSISREEKDSLGMMRLRFEQNYKGIPVFETNGKVKSVNEGVVAGINISVPGRPKTREAQAQKIARNAFRARHLLLHANVRETALRVLQPGMIDNSNDASSAKAVRKCDNVRHLNGNAYDCGAQPEIDVCWSDIITQANETRYGGVPDTSISYALGCRGQGCTTVCPHGARLRYLPEMAHDSKAIFSILADVHNYYQARFSRNNAIGLGGEQLG